MELGVGPPISDQPRLLWNATASALMGTRAASGGKKAGPWSVGGSVGPRCPCSHPSWLQLGERERGRLPEPAAGIPGH